MKKLLTVVSLCAALMLLVSSGAFANDNTFKLLLCGQGFVEAMILHKSSELDAPVADCLVSVRDFDYYTCDVNGNIVITPTKWAFTATAFGTQINLALLKAQNINEAISMCVEYDLNCGTCGLEIISTDCIGDWHNAPPHPYCE